MCVPVRDKCFSVCDSVSECNRVCVSSVCVTVPECVTSVHQMCITVKL